MIARQKGGLVFSCDSCSETAAPEKGESFCAAWSRLRSDGWRARRLGSVWVLTCPDSECRGG